ncbi:MAG: hypothetical protein R3C62_00755 [Chloroflexota bacterium]
MVVERNGRFAPFIPSSVVRRRLAFWEKTAVFFPIFHTDTGEHGWKNGRLSVFVRICVMKKTAVFHHPPRRRSSVGF